MAKNSQIAALYPFLSEEQLPRQNRDALFARVRVILELGHHVSQAVTIDEYVFHRREEAYQTADMLDDSATDEVKRNPKFISDFMPIVRSLSTTACMLDSLLDAQADVTDGKMALRPTKEYYARLAKETWAAKQPGMSAIMSPAVFGEFGKMSVDRLKNRLRHQKVSGSSLHNIVSWKGQREQSADRSDR